MGCLFCWLVFPTPDGARLGFSFIQVLEWYLGSKERPFFGPCSLTGNLGGSTSLAPHLFLLCKIHLAISKIHKLPQR